MTARRFEGRHVFVTGAGTGIGRATAVRFGTEGASLSLLARGAERLEETAVMAREAGAATVGVHPCDLRDREATHAAVSAAAEARGALHAVIANAGVGGPNGSGPDDRWEELIATNLTGTYHTLRAAERHLEPGPDRRHLVVVSSVLARLGVPGYSGYCASKAGLLGLVRSLANELGPDGVQVNAVCPGWVDTRMARDGIQGMADATGVSYEEAHAEAMKAVPLGRMARPEEIAGMLAWLCSVDAHGVTGQTLDMNGGAVMA